MYLKSTFLKFLSDDQSAALKVSLNLQPFKKAAEVEAPLNECAFKFPKWFSNSNIEKQRMQNTQFLILKINIWGNTHTTDLPYFLIQDKSMEIIVCALGALPNAKKALGLVVSNRKILKIAFWEPIFSARNQLMQPIRTV